MAIVSTLFHLTYMSLDCGWKLKPLKPTNTHYDVLFYFVMHMVHGLVLFLHCNQKNI